MDDNPILSEIGGLSPAAKSALLTAHQAVSAPPMAAPMITPDMKQAAAPSAEAPPPMVHPNMSGGVPSIGPAPSPNVIAPRGTLQGDKNELARKVSTGSGISQIAGKVEGAMPNHPFLGKLLGYGAQGLATLGNVGLDAVAPSVSAALPGTDYHHDRLIKQDQRNIEAEEGNAEKEAQTRNFNIQPELRQATQALNQEKQNEVEEHHRAQEKESLAQHGLTWDEENPGNVRAQRYEEMSEPQQAVYDLKGAQEEAQKATADLKRAQNDPQSSAYKLAQQRLQSAQQAHGIALQRLGLSEKQYEMRAHGTENGVPDAGSMITDDGRSVGTAFQQNVRPTGQERNKADMANSAAQQIGDMKSIITKRPDIFGPVAGRTTDFNIWLGSQDPDAQRFRAARTIAGDHLAGTFGGRSEAALKALDNALGQFKDNPEAALAGLDQLAGATGNFQKAGTVRTAGSNAGKVPSQTSAPQRPPGVPDNYEWNPQGNGGKGSWKAPQK